MPVLIMPLSGGPHCAEVCHNLDCFGRKFQQGGGMAHVVGQVLDISHTDIRPEVPAEKWDGGHVRLFAEATQACLSRYSGQEAAHV